MKKLFFILTLGLLSLGFSSSCTTNDNDQEEDYLVVIGEAEMQLPNAGYRLNLSYNGPMSIRPKFITWADSIQRELPGMSKISENIFLNYMPEQMGKEVNKDMYQTSISYWINVEDSTLFADITQDLLNRNIPFNINVMGTFLDPVKKAELQQELMDKALENAKTKLEYLTVPDRKYVVVAVEEIDNTTPYGPEYYDFNRKMVTRLRVKARLE
jgi:hypothetical protein